MKSKKLKVLLLFVAIFLISSFSIGFVSGKYITSYTKNINLNIKAKFFAKFDANGGTITSTSGDWYEVNDGDATKIIEVGQKIDSLPEVEKEGYTLVSWIGTGNLAEDYKEVEYIQSTGKQYLELDYYPTEEIIVEMKIAGPIKLGELENNSGRSYGQYWISSNQFGYSNNYTVFTYTWDDSTIYNLYCNKDKMYINDELVATVSGYTDQVFISNYKMRLFATAYAAGVNESNISAGKCYYFKIYEGNELKMHLVPCIETESNIVGMYDVVNSRFYSNVNKAAGSDFVAGPYYNSIYNEVVNEETIFEATSDLKYKANWKANNYTLTLKLNDEGITQATGANDGDIVTVEYDSKIKGLPNLERYGYEFLGWFDDEVNGNQYKNGDIVKILENKTLYAHWKTKKIKISFNTGIDSELPIESKEVEFGKEIGELPIPEKDGYTFKGWYLSDLPSEYRQVEYIEGKGNECIILDYYPTEKICLDYEFEGNFIIGELNGSSGRSIGQFWVSKGQFGYSNNFTTYTFTRQAGIKYHVTTDRNNLYIDGNKVASVSGYSNTFVSPFKLPIFAIRHNNGTPDQINTGKCYGFKVIEDEDTIINLIPVIRNSDNKPGMYDTENDYFYTNVIGNITDFGYGKEITLDDYDTEDEIDEDAVVTNENDFTLYAKWEANNYTINFDPNSEIGSTEVKGLTQNSITVTYDSTYGDFPELSRDGYNFIGWSEDDENVFDNSGKVDILEDKDLKALWSANEYKVHFDAGCLDEVEGLPEGNITVTFDEEYGELPTLTREKYKFNGWKISGVSDDIITSDSKVVVAQDHTLQAVWSSAEYSIIYEMTSGAQSSDLLLPNEYTAIQYIESDGNEYLDTKAEITKNSTVIADFEFTRFQSQYNFIFGSRVSGGDNEYSIAVVLNDSKNEIRSDYNDNNSRIFTNIYPQLNERFVIEKQGNKVFYNNKLIATHTEGNFTPPNTLTAFVTNYASLNYNETAIGRLYSFKVFEGEKEVRNMVPCIVKQTDEVGMYDFVTNKFYGASGSGEFKAGPILNYKQEAKYGEEITLLSSASSGKLGYSVVGWNTNKDGSGTTYELGQVVSNLTDVDGGVITLYPIIEFTKFEKLDYIESDGNQWIDTEIVLNQNSKVVIDFEFTRFQEKYNFIFGARAEAGINEFEVVYTNQGTSTPCIRDDYANQNDNPSNRIFTTFSPTLNQRFTLTKDKNNLYVGEELIATRTSANLDTVYSCAIFDTHYSKTTTDRSEYSIGRLYGFKIYENDILKLDLIPAYDAENKVVGMYDLVHGGFYDDQNKGKFIAGPIDNNYKWPE